MLCEVREQANSCTNVIPCSSKSTCSYAAAAAVVVARLIKMYPTTKKQQRQKKVS